MRRLIINADDFGLTPGINRAILEGHERGVISSATLMANGKAFDDAVKLARSVPTLSVGCHVVLTDGVPVLGASQIPTLVEGQPRPQFRESFRKFATAAITGRLDSDQIEAEATAQISKLRAAGIAVSHFDTHKHTHLFPQVLRPLLRAAEACGVRAVRNLFGPVRFGTVANRPKLWKRYSQMKLLCGLGGRFRGVIEKAGLKTPDGTLGIVGTGTLDIHLFQSIMQDLPHGTWEFVCHPGYNDADLQLVNTRLREARAEELRTVTSPAARELLAANGIELISYHDFASSEG
ncbi:MAG TPA: ChbG/HpnK family deacetylase [Terriglobales bacterium]|nr:ChbG/HpnK family deacetylase [Terriglobales bacterium]